MTFCIATRFNSLLNFNSLRIFLYNFTSSTISSNTLFLYFLLNFSPPAGGTSEPKTKINLFIFLFSNLLILFFVLSFFFLLKLYHCLISLLYLYVFLKFDLIYNLTSAEPLRKANLLLYLFQGKDQVISTKYNFFF